MWILVDGGVTLLFLATGFGEPEPVLAAEAGRAFSLDADLDFGLGFGAGLAGEGERRRGAALVSTPFFLTAGLPAWRGLDRDFSFLRPLSAVFLGFLARRFRSSLSRLRLRLESELESLLESLELSLLELELELLSFRLKISC